jgi:protease-4
MDDAVSLAKEVSGLKAARVIIYHRPGAYKNNIYSQLGTPGIGSFNLINVDLKTLVKSGAPSFMYLWSP